jgi:hypothetical protein
MKLSRNKIRKIRKQQHQSVRKWKKQHKSSGRRTTFRQSNSRRRRRNLDDISGTYPSSKLNSVINRTLKNYIPRSVMAQIKENYRKMRRKHRKQKHYKMTGGADENGEPTYLPLGTTDADTAVPLPAAVPESSVAAADPSAATSATATSAAATSAAATSAAATSATAAAAAAAVAAAAAAAAIAVNNNNNNNNNNEVTSKGATQPTFSLGPVIKGDITIRTESHECKNANEVWKLVEFLIQKGLPYYIQIEPKTGNKPLNKNDTNIFDLRRILYGKFTNNTELLGGDKQGLYLKANDVVGIANGDTFGVEQAGDFIYTGERCQILPASTDGEIQVKLLQEDAPLTVLTDSKRLYKITGKDANVKPASIDTIAILEKLDRGNKIDMTEFRLQIAAMSAEELNKDAENIAAGNDNPEVKTVVDESNTYVMNLELGCKITSIQTLKKSLERARKSLENNNDTSKAAAMGIFKTLTDLLQNPEFMKTDGFADFKESVYDFSYKIRGSERKYGMAQLQTFFADKGDSLSSKLNKEFVKLMKLLGHGPNGSNGECERFEGTQRSSYEVSRIKTLEKDGKIVTEITNMPLSENNMNGFGKQLTKIGDESGVGNEETVANEVATAAG